MIEFVLFFGFNRCFLPELLVVLNESDDDGADSLVADRIQDARDDHLDTTHNLHTDCMERALAVLREVPKLVATEPGPCGSFVIVHIRVLQSGRHADR